MAVQHPAPQPCWQASNGGCCRAGVRLSSHFAFRQRVQGMISLRLGNKCKKGGKLHTEEWSGLQLWSAGDLSETARAL